MNVSRSILFAATLLCIASRLPAQDEGTIGINLSVTGSTSLGVTWLTSPGFAIRPSVNYDWIKTSFPFAGSDETAVYGVDLDLLFRVSHAGRVTTYLGLGGGLVYYNPGAEPVSKGWLARTLLGVRVKVVDRVALFGELGLEYQSSDDQAFVPDRFTTTTAPIGVVVFLK
jgi:hypothetical protein